MLGKAWFQWRGFSPVPFFLAYVLLPAEFVPSAEFTGVMVTFLLACEGLRVWAVGYAGSATRTRGNSIPSLVQAGPFRWVRNPLYVANIGLYAGCGVLFGFKWLALACFIYTSIQYHFIVAYEEERLKQTFGEPYVKYQKEVPRWIPRFIPSPTQSAHSFDLAAALRSERSTVIALTVMAALYILKQNL
jgi:protein-S-isoprenylcysteine O-methyltransferase Ste14